MVSFFEDDNYVRISGSKNSTLDGLFRPFGAIAFPEEHDFNFRGCAMMGLQDVSTNKILVPDVKLFGTIKPVIVNGSIKEEGLVPFFLESWSRYKSCSYFYNDNRDTSRRFRKNIHELKELEPKPQFKRLKSFDLSSVFSRLRKEELKYKSNGFIFEALSQYDTQKDKGDLYIVVKTLGVLCYGFDRYI